MLRLTLPLGIVACGLVSLVIATHSEHAGRTLDLAEQSSLFGGQSGWCCGIPTRCQLPSPNPTCDSYHTDSDCWLKKYWANVSGNNLYECVVVVPSAICLNGSQYNACKGYWSCAWDSKLGVCYEVPGFNVTANCANSCGDTCA
jgi:hypothetical protein